MFGTYRLRKNICICFKMVKKFKKCLQSRKKMLARKKKSFWTSLKKLMEVEKFKNGNKHFFAENLQKRKFLYKQLSEKMYVKISSK